MYASKPVYTEDILLVQSVALYGLTILSLRLNGGVTPRTTNVRITSLGGRTCVSRASSFTPDNPSQSLPLITVSRASKDSFDQLRVEHPGLLFCFPRS